MQGLAISGYCDHISAILGKMSRQLLKTGRGCSISQLYLETGHTPARFEVMKMRCLFFNSILKESTESLIFKFIMAQYQNPVRGDWVSCCLTDLKYLNIDLSLE